MGIYAQTSFTINCETNKSAEEVAEKIKSLGIDENGNTFGEDVIVNDCKVFGFEESPRIQNLEYRIQEIWKAIKDIEGVENLYAPFLVESDGVYHPNEADTY